MKIFKILFLTMCFFFGGKSSCVYADGIEKGDVPFLRNKGGVLAVVAVSAVYFLWDKNNAEGVLKEGEVLSKESNIWGLVKAGVAFFLGTALMHFFENVDLWKFLSERIPEWLDEMRSGGRIG